MNENTVMRTRQILNAITRQAVQVARGALWACLLVASAQALAASDGKQPTGQARQAGLVSADAQAATTAGRDSVRGEQLGDIVKDFWRWSYSIPFDVNPLADPTGGLNCGINQEGAIWFLAAPVDSPVTRTCVIPHDKAIVTPVVAILDDWPCPPGFNFNPGPNQSLEEFLRLDVGSLIDAVTAPSVTLDGKALKVRRVASELFGFTAAANVVQFDSCVTGSPQLGLADGYWAFIDPLPRGKHTLKITASFPSVNVTFTLDVR
jgi:hypothetical protein